MSPVCVLFYCLSFTFTWPCFIMSLDVCHYCSRVSCWWRWTYSLPHDLTWFWQTEWCLVFLEQFMFTATEIPCRTKKSSDILTKKKKKPLLSPVLSQFIPLAFSPACLFKVYISIFPPSMPLLPFVVFSFELFWHVLCVSCFTCLILFGLNFRTNLNATCIWKQNIVITNHNDVFLILFPNLSGGETEWKKEKYCGLVQMWFTYEVQ